MSVTSEVSASSRRLAPPDGVFRLPLWMKSWLILLTVMVVVSWMGFGMHLLQGASPQPTTRIAPLIDAAMQPAASDDSREIAEGPWGRLEIIPITISPPLEHVLQSGRQDAYEVAWCFPSKGASELSDLLAEAGLPEELQARLKALAKRDLSIDGYTICPDRELVLGLGPEDRAKLYLLLHPSEENPSQRNAFRFCGDSIGEWFGDSLISAETKRLVTPLIYRQGSFLFFSDLQTVKPLLSSADERLSLVRALSCESTMLLSLKVAGEEDVEALINYWGRGGRAKEIRPILESLARLEGEQSIDVMRLLPPFARQRIYTYPTSAETAGDVVRDCHWSAMNFFSEYPDDRFGKPGTDFSTFAEDFYRIFGNPQFGDLVVYVNPKGGIVHSAVYIAADIVFTKNGNSNTRPWMFMKSENMKDFYPFPGGLVKAMFRRQGM